MSDFPPEVQAHIAEIEELRDGCKWHVVPRREAVAVTWPFLVAIGIALFATYSSLPLGSWATVALVLMCLWHSLTAVVGMNHALRDLSKMIAKDYQSAVVEWGDTADMMMRYRHLYVEAAKRLRDKPINALLTGEQKFDA